MLVHGFLNIDKPPGMTSHDVVAKLRRIVGQKRVGHGGTLDPAATGVLPVALGEATKLLSHLVEGRKRYLATVHLGVTTTTDDAAGEVLQSQPIPSVDRNVLAAALQQFVGRVQQVPPMYSAIQVGGQRMYDLARRGESVELAARTVEIDRIDVREWQPPRLTIEVTCGKGTYIRAIARDLGAALGCGAHLAALRRTQVGPLGEAAAVALDTLAADADCLPQHLLRPETAILDWSRVDVDEQTAKRIRNGLPVRAAHPQPVGEYARAHLADGTLLALLRKTNGDWQPFRVFSWA